MSLVATLNERAVERTEAVGITVPLHFGDPAAEYRAARESAALSHRPRRALIRVRGADHRRLLHGLLTSDIESLAPGSGQHALFLDTKGHVRGSLDLWAEDDATIVGCDPGFVDAALSDLVKYVLAADVQFEDLRPDCCVLAVIGPAADRLIAARGLPVPDASPRAHLRASLAGVEVRVARTPDLGAPGVELHVPKASASEVWNALGQARATGDGTRGDDEHMIGGGTDVAAAAGAGESAVPQWLGWTAAEALRIEAGVPRFGAEITGEEFPQEARLDDAIDYEKGCYLGQETVARIHYRGQVNRLLSGLLADAPLPVGADLVSSGREVGRVTSAAESPRRGPVALAYARRAESESGATVQVRHDGEDIAEARIVALPIGS